MGISDLLRLEESGARSCDASRIGAAPSFRVRPEHELLELPIWIRMRHRRACQSVNSLAQRPDRHPAASFCTLAIGQTGWRGA